MKRRHKSDGVEPDGYLLLRKRPGISSFDALNLVKRSLDTGRVGHSGTLDKFAQGLLVVLVGRSTRLVPWFTGCDKVYEGMIAFGAETDTLDPEGATVAEAPPPSESALRSALSAFRGSIMQAPPLYSSVHVNGLRAHQIARSGATVEMALRPVTIYDLELLSYNGTDAEIRVRCSKGTYIRSLARDIALACGSRAHLKELLRTDVAGFSFDEAVDPYESEDPDQAVRDALKPIDERAFTAIGVPVIHMSADSALGMVHGKPLDPSRFTAFTEAASIALFLDDGRFLAVVERADGKLRYGFVSLRKEDL